MCPVPLHQTGGEGAGGLAPDFTEIYRDFHSLLRGWCPKLFSVHCFLPPPPNDCVWREDCLGSKASDIRLPGFRNPSI